MHRTLSRYCEHRMRYNRREQRATRFNGLERAAHRHPPGRARPRPHRRGRPLAHEDSALQLVEDHLGWVFAWIGLWYPLDAFFFYPLSYGRENRVLALLAEAEIGLRPYDVSAAGSPI